MREGTTVTLVVEDGLPSNGDGKPRTFRDALGQATAPPVHTNGHGATGQAPRPARILGPVRNLWPEFHPFGSSNTAKLLSPLKVVETYPWYSDYNYQHARSWRDAAVAKARSHSESECTSATREAISWLVAAILDRYCKDRAESGATVIPKHPRPQLFGEIPQSIEVNYDIYFLKMSPLQWTVGTPVEAADRFTALFLRAEPDTWHVATYERNRAPRDPLIYAQYGDWYLKVAEWP